jgi:hypothetical protein
MTESLLQNDLFVRALLSKLERERGLNLEGLSDEEQQMESVSIPVFACITNILPGLLGVTAL